MSEILVDDKRIEAAEGDNLLQTCLKNGVFIPNLCYMKSMDPAPASCRMCFVEIEGFKKPVTSCTQQVREGMVVRTDTEAVRRLQKTGFKLLMSTHHIDPKHCPAAKRCQLHRISKFLGVRLSPKPLERLQRDVEEVVDLGCFDHYPFRCIHCGRCIHVCRNKNGKPLLTFANRGFETIVGFFDPGGGDAENCPECGACEAVCPTAALLLKEQYKQKAAEGA
jgi:NADH dehydrogenase/NADH:ubiquinone oxidoreductase subunit G